MKKIIFLLLTVIIASNINVQGQTYYYVSHLQILPNNPTTNDIIKVNVSGSFASTGSYIVNQSVSVNGFQINLVINCADPGGYTVIVPHDTIFTIGMLPAGTYSINLSGTALGDYVSTPEKTFVVNAFSGIGTNITCENKAFVYPNPCKDYFYIDINNNSEFKTEIYNSCGLLVSENHLINHGIINITNLKQGIYFIKIIRNNISEIQKVIKY